MSRCNYTTKTRTILAERHVVLARATLVAVALNDDHTISLRRQMLRDCVDLAKLTSRNDRRVEAKVHRREINIGAAGVQIFKLALGHAGNRTRIGTIVAVGINFLRVNVGTSGVIAGTRTALTSLVILATRSRNRETNCENRQNR